MIPGTDKVYNLDPAHHLNWNWTGSWFFWNSLAQTSTCALFHFKYFSSYQFRNSHPTKTDHYQIWRKNGCMYGRDHV